MAIYSYVALTSKGGTRKGIVEADSAKLARSVLRNQSLLPLEVHTLDDNAQPKLRRIPLFRTNAFNSASLAVWTRQLAGLITSELTLEHALDSLSEDVRNERLSHLLAVLHSQVNEGMPFARALAQHPREFPDTFVAVIAAGEQSGKLGAVLERLAEDLENQQALKAKLVAAALYPSIVAILAVVIVIFLMTYVVPQVAQVFIGSKRVLPLLTVIFIGISDLLRKYGWMLLMTTALVAVGLRHAWSHSVYREKLDNLLLHFPLLGDLSRSYNTVRFASTLAMLADSGVPLLKALQASAETMSNSVMRSEALNALELVREGVPLTTALARQGSFPHLLVMFVRLGEQSGKLPLMLQRSATQLNNAVQRRAMQMATILEPLLIVAMGGLVMLIVLAVLLPIIQLNHLVK